MLGDEANRIAPCPACQGALQRVHTQGETCAEPAQGTAPTRLRRALRRKPKKPQLLKDYVVFDMDRMTNWGHNAFWWPSEYVGERACLFGRRPRTGDVLKAGGVAYVITASRTAMDPGDQHFVSVEEWGAVSALPESEGGHSSWINGLV